MLRFAIQNAFRKRDVLTSANRRVAECPFHGLLILEVSSSGSNWQIFRSNLDLAFFKGISQSCYVFKLGFAAVAFFVAGAVFGTLLVSRGYETVPGAVFCEVRQFRRYSIVVQTRGLFFGLPWLRLCHSDLHFTVRLPRVYFMTGAALWACFLCLVFIAVPSGLSTIQCCNFLRLPGVGLP